MFIQSLSWHRRAHLFLPKTQYVTGIVIHAPGMPGYPKPSSLNRYYHDQWYAILRPMWSWSGESEGVFSTKQCCTDLLDWITYARQWIFLTDINTDGSFATITIKNTTILLMGTSFGAWIAGLMAYHPDLADITTIHFLSPMRSPHRYRDDTQWILGVQKHRHIITQAFPRSWTVDETFWDDMVGKNIFDPYKIQGPKKSLTVIHGRDDTICPLSMGKRCADDVGAHFVVVDWGHSSAMNTEQIIQWLSR